MKKGVGQKQKSLRFLMAWFFAALFMSSSAAIPASAITSNDITTGAKDTGGTTYSTMTAEQAAESYALYYGVVRCMTGINKISNDEVIDVSQFEGAANAYLYSYYIDPSDAKSECQTAIKKGLTRWGYGTFEAALRDWGYNPPKADSNDPTWTASNPGVSTAAALRNRVYAGSQPLFGPVETYVYWAQGLAAGCKVSNPVPYDTAGTAMQAAVNNPLGQEYVKVTEAKPDLSGTIDMIYKVGQWDSYNWYMPLNSPQSGFYDCREVAAKLTPAVANAYIIYAQNNNITSDKIVTPNRGISGAGSSEPTTTCAIDGVGWIVCPVINFLAKITDKSYSVVSGMLEVKAFISTSSGDTDSLYKAWSTMRNIANIMFVIVFMIIIFSQVSSIGISNYGIKHMLPRLIIAAILVNVSFWVCAVAVDVSNLVGSSVKGFFDSGMASFAPTKGSVSNWASGSGWEGLAGGILAATIITGTSLYIGLAALLPALISAVMAIVTVLIVLTLRQALIILLIVVSPLAFVAYLLPNTEPWFKKWRQLFTTLLLMYPIIGLIFGASGLASSIVMTGAGGGEGAGDEAAKIAIQVMGAAIAVIPLFITPVVMKSAGNVLGKVGGVVGMMNNPNKGPFDRMRKGADRIRENQEGKRSIRAMSGGRFLGSRKFKRAARKNAISEGIKHEQKYATSDYIADQVKGDEEFRNKVAGGSASPYVGRASDAAMQRTLANAINVKASLEADEVKAATALIQHANLSSAEAANLANGAVVDRNGIKLSVQGNASMAMAARRAVVDSGDADAINTTIDGMRGLNANIPDEAQQLNDFADALERSHSKPAYVQPADLQIMRQNGVGSNQIGSANEMIMKALRDNVYSPDRLGGSGRQELGKVAEAIAAAKAAGPLTAENTSAIDQLKQNAQAAVTDPRIEPRLGKQKATVEEFTRL